MSDTIDNNFIISGEGDHYASHLAQVNGTNNSIVTTEDIYNDNGVLLLRKGVTVDTKASQQIIKHKLIKPIEYHVALEQSLNGQTLYRLFNALENKYPEIKQINDKLDFANTIKDFFTKRTLHPILIQKLSIMQQQLPHELEKGLFCAWLCALAGRHLDFERHKMHDAFIAGLVHDIGFMHLDPDIVLAERQLTPAEWRTMQGHVVIGKVLLDHVPDINPDIAQAVLEHHENCDGTGYPYSKMKTDLKCLAHVVAMVDSIHAVRGQYEKNGRNLADALAYLQLNNTTHTEEVYCSIYAIIKLSGINKTEINPCATVEAYASQLYKQISELSTISPILMDLLTSLLDLQQNIQDKKLQSIVSVTTRMVTLLHTSGLPTNDHLSWLKQMAAKAESGILAELNQTELMLKELWWQLRNTSRFLSLFVDSMANAKEDDLASLRESMTNIDNCLSNIKEYA